MLCRAAVPGARLLDEVVSNAKMDKAVRTRAKRQLVDTLSLIVHANNTLNFQRREAVKRKLPPSYNASLKAPENASTTLFGDDCGESLNKAG